MTVTNLLDGPLGKILRSPRLGAAAVALGALATVWGLASWGTAESWVPPTTTLPIDRIADASARLDEAGIPYRLERGGSLITVPEQDVARTRVLLAGEGMLEAPSRPGFELFDQPSWGMTDFTQRINLRRALEGELQRTISEMRGVEEAQVHLAMHESGFIGDDRPSEASVVLRLTTGAPADEGMVEGIRFLVASSVEDLAPEAVMVLDDRGRLLSTPDEEGGAGPSLRQLQVRREIENHLEHKAEAVLAQLVGPGNATVRVAADLSFDRVDRTVEQIDPAQQVTVSEEKSQITPGTAEQGAAQITSSTVYQTPKTVETTSRGGIRVERLTVAVVVNERPVDGSEPATTEPRSAAEMDRFRTLVANAVGVSPDRGDEISVVSLPSEIPTVAPLVPAGGLGVGPAVALSLWRPLVTVIALVVAAIVALRLMSTLGAASRAAAALAPPPTARALPPGEPEAAVMMGPGRTPLPIAVTAVADPKGTATLLRSWMKDG